MLSWRQAQPCGQVAPLPEGGPVTHRGYERGRVDDPYSGDRRQTARVLIVASQTSEFVIVGPNPTVEVGPGDLMLWAVDGGEDQGHPVGSLRGQLGESLAVGDR